MLKTTFDYDDFYNIISSLLNSSFNISTTKIGKISELSNYLNLEFRKLIWSNEDTNNTMINGISEMKKNALCIVHSAMEFTTIVFSFSHEISNDTLFIGPFLENEPNDEFINYILKKNNIDKNFRNTITTYYKSLPIASSTKVVLTLHTLLESFITNYDSSSMYYVDFSKEKQNLSNYNHEKESGFYIEYHKQYKSYLNDIFKHARLGIDGTDILNAYFELTGVLKTNSIDKIKNNLYILNTQFESELLKEPVSTVQVRDLYIKIQLEIENETNVNRLIKIPYKMFKRYSNLILNFNLQEYSYTVRCAIEYINFNLQSNLSLSTISESIGKNSSFLSNQFKKETKKTITKYIQERRIEEAMRMLTYTDLTIQQISHLVGIDDLSWFSKLFKSITNMSPTKYRSDVHKSKKEAI